MGAYDGLTVGTAEGEVGPMDGRADGAIVGWRVEGVAVGTQEGAFVGVKVDGFLLGTKVGAREVGRRVEGDSEGRQEGIKVGAVDGIMLGS